MAKTHKFSITLGEVELSLLEKYAAHNGITRAEAAREIISESLLGETSEQKILAQTKKNEMKINALNENLHRMFRSWVNENELQGKVPKFLDIGAV